jgi:polysaccharide export outer membrane protein
MRAEKIFQMTLIVLILFFFIPPPNAESQADPSSDHYLIGPNDLLNIFVWKEPDLTQDISVMPDGRITFPMIGTVMAEGQTVVGLKNIITEKLKDFVSEPEVTVIVRASNSRIVYTIGKVVSPGPYPLASDMTVLQALSTAGGFAQWAETKQIKIVRRKKGKEVMLRFNYDDFIKGKDLKQNIVLEPNDTIIVP